MSKVIYIEKLDIGATLTTWIYCAMWQMWAAEQMGYSGYIHWPDGMKPGRCLKDLIDKDCFSHYPNMYDWYFQQPHVLYKEQYKADEVWTWEQWKDPSPVSFMAQPLSVIKDFYKRRLHFSSSVEIAGQAIVNKYGVDFSKTIGITWRGTDNVTDGRPRLPIEVYFPFIDDILKDNPDYRIMCTAEEEGILQPLLNRYPQAFNIDEFVSAKNGAKDNPERNDSRSGFERGMQPALMVWLFSKCAHYIKNRSSTGAVASWLSSGRIVNLAHEETLSYLKMDDQVEIDGIKYPLYR